MATIITANRKIEVSDAKGKELELKGFSVEFKKSKKDEKYI